MKYVDVAGGSGELTRALLDPSIGAASSSVVIDPRQDSKKCGVGID
jgi:hypothetical protein